VRSGGQFLVNSQKQDAPPSTKGSISPVDSDQIELEREATALEHDKETEQAEARTAEAIRASELRYRRLFETAQDGILILDADTGQVMDANPFMKDLLGYSQEGFLGRK